MKNKTGLQAKSEEVNDYKIRLGEEEVVCVFFLRRIMEDVQPPWYFVPREYFQKNDITV